ncbi:Transposase DDE domain protein [Rubripirellula obstinata]|uniref:Transposase DDE domain protein n=1 Tax=Rubripirellula obstinata TaxID=406547 RepID=A0A5B1CBU5_9BACT|nr:transposase [Rubripirellula obstinata]KAA1257485.1 Transposase DDE domain protein [Rubripirellula obstinata]KAA1259492.1 Transposase DDE domain protein [Rubripirellula obstinata]
MSRKKSAKQAKHSQTRQRREKKKARKAKKPSKRSHKQDTNRALKQFFGIGDIFANYQFHGNITWSAMELCKLALLFSFSEKQFITDAFDETLKRGRQLAIGTTHTTYQGFMGALTNYGHIFVPLMILRLQQQMQKLGGELWEISGFVPIAFDGSRNSAARTRSNELELCSSKLRQKQAAAKSKTVIDPKPQAWITLMWHMGFRLPWNWRLGPSDSSERAHVQEMVENDNFPENTLFVGDAGFVGYDFWMTMVSRGYHFMVRVGSNVKLISEIVDFQLTEGGEVLCWPKGKQGQQPPLRLRLVQVKIGNAEVYLLTSVLSPARLSVETMAELYKKRWGIEIEFRGLKQTLNGQKLRCRNVDRLYTELHWSILAMAVAELLAVSEQLSNPDRDPNYTPKDRSLAGTMRALYDCLDDLHTYALEGEDLFSRLARAVTDNYERNHSKQARFKPKVSEKKKKKIKPPEVRPIEKEEREKLQRIDNNTAA